MSLKCDSSDRIAVLKRKARAAYSKEAYELRQPIAEAVFAEHPDEPQAVKVALILEAFLQQKPLITHDEDLLAGYTQDYGFAMPGIDPCSSNCPPRKDAPDRPWEHRLPEQVRSAFAAGLYSTCPGAHHIPGYHRVLERGLGAFADDARVRLESATGDARDFTRAALIGCEAASAYVRRYADRFKALAKDAAPERRADFERIAKSCRHVATEPARGFFDALQLLWLTHEVITCEQCRGSLSFGRFDVYMHPFYERDRAAGALSREEAQELVDALWVKFGGYPMSFQHVTLGGQDGQGGYVANDLTYMALRASRKLRMDQPLLGLRWHPSMPDDLWDEAQQLIELGTGFPALFNDEPCIEAKVRLGIPREEAIGYGIVGCVEMSMPAREYGHTEGFRMNFLKVLELMLNRGICPLTGETLALLEDRDPDSVESFNDLYAWYKRELVHAVDGAAAGMDIMDEDFPKYKPTPFASLTCEGCLEKGKDVSDGGTVYNFSTLNVTGQANTVDALVSVKRLVFDERRYSLSELAAILRDDFEGHEGLRAEILRYPKYGNDKTEPDAMMTDLMDAFAERLAQHTNRRGGPFQAGLFTAGWHGVLGNLTGASADGRRARKALCSGSSPAQGADTTGPTAVLGSATKFDHAYAGNGLVLDLKFHPTFFEDANQSRAFRHLVEGYFAMGGMELQVNVVNRETLIEAQKHPEEHRDLLVRVSGYSAYFVDIGKVLQDEVIARTEMATL